MRRELTAREWMLIGVLGILLAISGYILLFYNPMTSERDRCISETETCKMQTEAANLRIADKHRMELELEELFAAEVPPVGIPDYENLKPVMFELNSILSGTQNYNLSFSTVDASQTIVRRSIAMTFTTDSYASAKAILGQLHDSGYRCMIDNVSISFSNGGYRVGWWGDLWGDSGEYIEGNVSVNATIVFFEYQKEVQTPAAEAAPAAEPEGYDGLY